MDWQNYNLRILNVEAVATKRQIVNQELRSRGYTDITGVNSLKAAMEVLEKETFSWALIPMSTTSKPNTLAFLEYIIKSKEQTRLNITLVLLEPKDSMPGLLKKAFELGIFSYLEPYQSKTEIEKEFNRLFQYLEMYRGNQPYVSAAYLRPILMAEKNHEALLKMEKKLAEVSIPAARALIDLAIAYSLNDQKTTALGLLQQALLLDPKLRNTIENIKSEYGIESGSQQKDPMNIVGIDHILIVEPDGPLYDKFASLLGALGIADITHKTTSHEALTWLHSNPSVPLIITEWQVDEVPGPIFVQKIRALKIQAPIVVCNDKIDPEYAPLLRELGLTHMIRKPFFDEDFYQQIFWVVNQDKSPTEPFFIRDKLRQALKEQDMHQVGVLKRKYIAHPKTTKVDHKLINAEISYCAGFYHKAKQYALEALQWGGDSLAILSILAKSLMHLREFEAALTCFENASVISPANIERLCLIAESHLEMGEDGEFKKKLDDAKDLDPYNNITIMTTEAKGAIKQGQHKKARELMKKLDSLRDIVAFTNNRGVALIRNEHFEEGKSLYEDAIMSMPEYETEMQATLYYNLGLANARQEKLPEALTYLKKASELYVERIQAKVQSLMKRVQHAISQQKQLKLKKTPTGSLQGDTSGFENKLKEIEELVLMVERTPGSHNLYLVYYSDQTTDPQVRSLMAQKVS